MADLVPRPATEEVLETPRAMLGPAARWAVGLATVLGIALATYQLFNLGTITGVVMVQGRYLYVLAGVFLATAFLAFPLRVSRGPQWPDWILAALSVGACAYFASTADTSLEMGWEYAAPETATWISILLYLLILEATRRAGGLTLFIIVLAFSLYPTVADVFPDPLSGFQQDFWYLAPYHMISSESSFGIPMRAFGNLVIGFIVFGAVLQHTGGGKFFNDLALALVGGFRGGAAKVAIFASGFMGSMSGSVISNVLTTGSVSIPAMKRTGFSARYAAATEACASTGGVLMPPIMGATAFVMASFISRPYVEIAMAAAIPSILFYFGLFAQVDAYAARRGLKGLAKGEAPTLRAAFAEGWPYILVFAVLIYLMVGLRQDTLAPFYATGLLLVINQVLPSRRFSIRSFGMLFVAVGRALAELVAVLLGVGLIVGAFSATGLAGTLVNELIFLAGDNVYALLAMGALTAFVFGMGMTVTAAYIFLAVVLAPALEQAAEPARRPPLHPLLGHGQLHHPARRPRRLRRLDAGGRRRHAHRLRGDEARRGDLHRPLPLRAEPRPRRPGSGLGGRAGAEHRAGRRLVHRLGAAGLRAAGGRTRIGSGRGTPSRPPVLRGPRPRHAGRRRDRPLSCRVDRRRGRSRPRGPRLGPAEKNKRLIGARESGLFRKQRTRGRRI